MEHMKFETPDLTVGNVEKIAALFPNCVTEMLDEEHSTEKKKVYKKAINFDLLRQMLSGEVVEGDEAYEFTWVGKKASIVEANRPIRKTLRPCPEESVDWDTTENLYIEGDNLEVLKLLQESYLGKVKLIYIDPPYNTGGDFIYRDNFKVDSDEYDEQLGMYDEGEKKLFKNTDSNGRFHSDWCSMIFSRLMLARNLLTNDGVIFISIGDDELHNMRNMCDEAFGANSFVSLITRGTGTHTGVTNRAIVSEADYILVYAKNIEKIGLDGLPLEDKDIKIYDMEDESGRFLIRPLRRTGGENRREDRPNMYFPIEAPDGTYVYPIGPSGYESRWICNPKGYEYFKKEGRIFWKKDDLGKWTVYQKFYLENKKKAVSNVWSELEGNKKATRELRNIFSDFETAFDFPKPVGLIKQIAKLLTDTSAICLDFFSGSATTAHAVMQLNAEDGGHRKFIMVQLPEKTDEKSEAYKAGYKNICEIGKERIRRAGAKIKADNPLTTQDLDVGFRVFKVDDTNMEDVYYSPAEYTQEMLSGMESNIKPDRSDLDLLFGCLLDWGLPLSLPYHSETIDGCTVHTYAPGDAELDIRDALIACFDNNVPESVIKEIAGRKPLRAVFRDSSFASSPEKINVEEIFAMLAPDTKVRVI